MRIPLDSLPPRGRDVRATAADAWALQAAVDALGAEPEALELAVTVYRLDHDARVRGTARASFATTCARCAAPVRATLSGDVDLTYQPAGVARATSEAGELTEEDMDVGFFDGRALDLGSVLAEQLALWLPDVLRCDSPGVERLDPEGACAVPIQDPGPDLKRRNPFAGIVLPE